MAITAVQLANALRVGDTTEETEIVTRLLGVGTAMVERYAPGAPVVIQDEATIRVAAYLFDQPHAGARGSYANALRNSGAAALLAQWRVQRADALTETPLPAGFWTATETDGFWTAE